MIKKIIKNLTPPFLLKIIRIKNRYGWFGNYTTWENAKKDCSGYNTDVILEKCKNSAQKVKDGLANFERDSFLFYKNDNSHSWIILVGILHCISKYSEISILDFGGSLGSSYYQNKNFLATIKNISIHWNIVEQKNFVECGKNNFEDGTLNFFYTVESVTSVQKINILLLSGTLQYLEKPLDWISKFLSLDIEYIIIDRTAFIDGDKNIITIQKVPPTIYEASYPAWAFNEDSFLSLFLDKYDIILDQENPDKSNYTGMYFKGFILKKK